MPELPDVAIYIERLDALFGGQVLEQARLKSPFLVRSFEPPLSGANGRRVTGFRRIGKRVVFEFAGDLFLVFHLMIAGRFHLKTKGAPLVGKQSLLGLDFAEHTLVLTEAGSTRRASLHVVQGAENLAEFERGGLEVLNSTRDAFRQALVLENRTLKRALTDPRLFSGIGNAYSDEILHAARLSPVKLTRSLAESEVTRLYAATTEVLEAWIDRLRQEVGAGFPEKVTAFRPEMACARPLPKALPGVRDPPSSVFPTLPTNSTIVRSAKPPGNCWPIAASLGCSKAIGRRASKSWKSTKPAAAWPTRPRVKRRETRTQGRFSDSCRRKQ